MPSVKGYFDTNDSLLFISVTNLKGFEELIKKAKKQADELQETIDQLENFELNIKFLDNKVYDWFSSFWDLINTSAFRADKSESINETVASIKAIKSSTLYSWCFLV